MTTIETLRGLLEEATKGDWEGVIPPDSGPNSWTDSGKIIIWTGTDSQGNGTMTTVAEVEEGDEQDDNLRLIAAAVNALPALLAVAEVVNAMRILELDVEYAGRGRWYRWYRCPICKARGEKDAWGRWVARHAPKHADTCVWGQAHDALAALEKE